ncbi:MAG: hypothetical protein ACYDHU_01890 [Acidimicrobiales bacterium]
MLTIVALEKMVPAAPLPACTDTPSWEAVQVASLAVRGAVVVVEVDRDEVDVAGAVEEDVVDDAGVERAAEELPAEEHPASVTAAASVIPMTRPPGERPVRDHRTTRAPPFGLTPFTTRSLRV